MKGNLLDSNLVVKTDHPYILSDYIIIVHIFPCHLNILPISFFCKKSCSFVRKKKKPYKEKKQLTCNLVILPCGLPAEDIHGQSAHKIQRLINSWPNFSKFSGNKYNKLNINGSAIMRKQQPRRERQCHTTVWEQMIQGSLFLEVGL